MNLYCIYDRVSGRYGPIVESENDQTIIRAVKTMKDQVVLANPGDFDVYALGEKSDVSGTITPKLEFLAHITEVLDIGRKEEN